MPEIKLELNPYLRNLPPAFVLHLSSRVDRGPSHPEFNELLFSGLSAPGIVLHMHTSGPPVKLLLPDLNNCHLKCWETWLLSPTATLSPKNELHTTTCKFQVTHERRKPFMDEV